MHRETQRVAPTLCTSRSLRLLLCPPAKKAAEFLRSETLRYPAIQNQLDAGRRPALLLVAQRHDGIELGSLHGRPDPEEQPYTDGDSEGRYYGPHGHPRR